MNDELLQWLREQLAKAEQSVKAREQGEKTLRSGTDDSWREVAKMCGGPFMTKVKRLESADRDKRIGVKCARDVAMFEATIAIVETQQTACAVSDVH